MVIRHFLPNIAVIFFLVTTVLCAQEEIPSADCNLSGFVTYSAGSWGSPGKSPQAKLRDQNFSDVFPDGLTAGSIYTLKLTSAQSVSGFLPQGGKATALSQNYVDPVKVSVGMLAGQLVTAMLNCGFSSAGFLGNNSDYKLEELIIMQEPFQDKSVAELLVIANAALGGEETEYTFMEITSALIAFNENFDNGSVDNGLLACPPEALEISENGAIGNLVWYDANRNGIREVWESGLAGVTVKLFNCDNNFLSDTVSGEDGYYVFEKLAPGEYYLQVMFEDQHISAADQGTDEEVDSDFDPVTGKTGCITLAKDENNFSVDAALYNTFAIIGDKVWYDLNSDGFQSRYEPGVEGMNIKLYDCSGNLKDETTSDEWGNYYFRNVRAGFYSVQFILPNGYVFTKKNASLSTGIDSDAGADGFTICMEMSPEEYDYSWDAGLVPEAGSQGIGINPYYVNKINSSGYSEIPSEFNLSQNYPNPFNPETIIEFSVALEGTYSLRVYNLLGQEIKTLFNDYLNPGSYYVTFEGNDLISGTYFYNLSGNGVNMTRKMSLVK